MIYLGVKFYIVRHGSTDQLENKRRQTDDSRLSQSGLEQIRKIRKRLKKIKIDVFFSSPIKRTDEAAQEIVNTIGQKYKSDERLREIDHAKALYGAKFTDEIAKQYDNDKLNWLTNLDWKFLNQGESLRDVLKRTAEFKNDMIKNHLDKNILIVSHAYAIRCLIASCIMGDKYTDGAMLRTVHAVRISKASLSILEYLAENKYFYVNLLNDTTHLDI